jgi:hypothetical protein
VGVCGTLRAAAGGVHGKASLFQPTLSPGWKDEEPGPKNETQMGRALRELGIEWIAAHSPQANAYVSHCTSLRLSGMTGASRRNASFTPWAFLGPSHFGASYKCSGLSV